jgi:hypothetical protein
MIINIFKTFVLASIILLSDYYFMAENIRLATLSVFFLMLFYAVENAIIRRRRAFTVDQNTGKILKVAICFIGYIFLIDLYRGTDIFKLIVFVISSVMIIILLPIFEDRRTPYNIIRKFNFLMFITMMFGLMQFLTNSNIILSDIISGLGLIGVDQGVNLALLSDNYFRTTGATSNNIGFALQLSMFIIVNYVILMQRWHLKILFNLIISSFILFTTQTRAAIFGLAPVIIATQALFARMHKNFLKMTSIIGWALVIGVGYWLLNDLILKNLTYIGRDIIEHDVHRFSVNWNMSIGVLKESPLFGISPERAWDIYLKYGDLRVYDYNADIKTPTHHNQFAFYFRYYGFVGVGLLCWLYVMIFRKIMQAKSFWIGFALGSIFIFDLVFSMVHNNKLIASPLLWIFLSLASIDPEKEESPL